MLSNMSQNKDISLNAKKGWDKTAPQISCKQFTCRFIKSLNACFSVSTSKPTWPSGLRE